MYLETINSPADLKKLSVEEMTALAAEMREALIVRASRHMGHVGPDLGFIEATVALHAVFSSPEDKIIYDISHQTYPHKMLTGPIGADTTMPMMRPFNTSCRVLLNSFQKTCIEGSITIMPQSSSFLAKLKSS